MILWEKRSRGKTEGVCPLAPASGAGIAAFTAKRAAPGYAFSMRRTVRTPVAAALGKFEEFLGDLGNSASGAVGF
jgi:hypothetical protein